MKSDEDYKHDMAMMLAFHDALRRELGHIARISAASPGDPRDVMTTAVGWQMFKDYLHVHHGCEDDVLWPAMEKTLVDRPDGLALPVALEAEHAAIDPLLAAIDASVTDAQWQDFGQEHAQRIGTDAPRVFPWMLDGLDEAKTEHILQAIPEPLQAAYRNQWLGAYGQIDLWGASPRAPKRAS